MYNADEFVLFYRVQPTKTLHLKNEKFVGGKHSKLHLPKMAGATVGDKLPMFLISDSTKPRCF